MKHIDGITKALAAYYDQWPVAKRLNEAIYYSIDSGGKRLRPVLLLQLLEGFGVLLTDAHYQVAAGLEMIHTGSLIHDDLPAMDNDDYRRGRLTNHKQFDDATAILAGDSLFLDPFGLIARAELPAQVRLNLIAELSEAAGTYGMVGGQMLDMMGEGRQLTVTELKTIHANKTGKLLAFPFLAAGIIAELDSLSIADLRLAGELVGLAFQVRDDILDVTASFEELGKTPQKDLSAQKSTYPRLLGLNESYDLLNDCLDQALAIFQKLERDEDMDLRKVRDMIERLRLHG
ncbi:polyprenyl synthetase family protein [Streptococcus entericus]|uniref:polyprenyl synthetase family protein n=1 Tax=Streptococcus entericus TaxID=155680 RepID=UPI0003744362|nr:farnesyl diphosphate synthase [Streptococcus entericus]